MPPHLDPRDVKVELAIETGKAFKVYIDLLDGTHIRLYLPSMHCTVAECYDQFEHKLNRKWPRRNVHWNSIWTTSTLVTTQGVPLSRNDPTKLRDYGIDYNAHLSIRRQEKNPARRRK